MKYSDSCNVQNMVQAANQLLGVSPATFEAFRNKFQLWKEDPTKNVQPRYIIARHHFPIELIMRDAGEKRSLSWVSPLTKEEAEKLKCYEHNTCPPHLDEIMRYDPTLGSGQSQKSKQKYGKKVLIRVAPCASLERVTELAAAVQNDQEECYDGGVGKSKGQKKTTIQYSARANQPYLIDVGMQAVKFLEGEKQEEANDQMEEERHTKKRLRQSSEDKQQRKKQRAPIPSSSSVGRAFLNWANELNDGDFVQHVAMEFERRGYVFGMKLEPMNERAAPSSHKLPLGVLVYPSATRPSEGETNRWCAQYTQLESFYERHGHIDVPRSSKSLHDFVKRVNGEGKKKRKS
jgi:hypothetical protein